MYKIFLIIFIFFDPIFSIEADDIYSTRFEKFWKKNFNKMNFREPITFMPYVIKIGHYSYGGQDYWENWSDVLVGEDIYNQSPYSLNDNNFPNIVNSKYRQGLTIELDMLKYNFFSQYQNFIDILFGIGYKYNQTSQHAYYDDIALKPNFQGWNINTTILKQWGPKFFTHLHYSYGLTQAKFYETSNGNATGNGMAHCIGFGFNLINPSKTNNNNNNYGLEIRFEEYKIDDINEPQSFDKIKDFHMKSVGLVYSFGIGYGGNQSVGDKAYLDLMKGNYIESLEKFQKYQYVNPYQTKQEDIKTMMDISRENIPSQLYNKAMENYYKGDLDQAITLLYQAEYKSNDSLNFEIESKKYVIANEMYDNSDKIIADFPLEEKIIFFNNIKKISNKIDDKINQQISSILIKKGDNLILDKKYELAYDDYLLSLSYYPPNQYIIDIKIDNMTINILNDVYKFLQINEHVIAYEHLSFIKNISRYNKNTKALMDIITKKIEDDKLENIRGRVQNMLDTESNFVVKTDPQDIFLGDSYDEILDILGQPVKIVNKQSLNSKYEMLIFIIDQVEYKLFFKNKLLIDVERES